MREVRRYLGREVFPVLLKGTAWIDKENHQIIHLETDLGEPIPKAKLYLEHQALDYGPVQFEKNGTRMWLPQNAEIFINSGNKHFHHRHSYSRYRFLQSTLGREWAVPNHRNPSGLPHRFFLQTDMGPILWHA